MNGANSSTQEESALVYRADRTVFFLGDFLELVLAFAVFFTAVLVGVAFFGEERIGTPLAVLAPLRAASYCSM